MQPRNVYTGKDWHTRIEYFAPRFTPQVIDPVNSGTISGHYRDIFTQYGGGPNWDKSRRAPVEIDYIKEFKTPAMGEYTSLTSDLSLNPQMEWKRIGAQQFNCRFATDAELYDIDANLYNKCLTKFNDKIKMTETNLALSLFELKETSKTVGWGKSIPGLIVAAKKAKRDFLRNPSRSLSKIWLGYKYAWYPAVTDVYNWLHYTHKAFTEGVKVKARAGSYKARDNVYSPGGDFSWANARERYTIQKRVEIGGVLYIADHAAYDRSRITSLDPRAVIWELTPLSFVFDWFVDVSSYLANYEAAVSQNLQFKYGYWTWVSYVRGLAELYDEQEYYDWSSWSHIRQSIGCSTFHLRAYKSRRFLPGFPLPMPPRLKVNLGTQQILSAVALARTILLGRAR